MTELDIT